MTVFFLFCGVLSINLDTMIHFEILGDINIPPTFCLFSSMTYKLVLLFPSSALDICSCGHFWCYHNYQPWTSLIQTWDMSTNSFLLFLYIAMILSHVVLQCFLSLLLPLLASFPSTVGLQPITDHWIYFILLSPSPVPLYC